VSGAPAEPPLATRRLHLKPGRERSVLQGHPWLFSGAVAREDGPEDAPLALVLAADGAPLALGFHNPRSQIRARLAAAPGTPIDGAFFRDRIAAAVRRRHELLPPETDGFRLINAEGDDLPGWTVDRFGSTLVSEITAAGLDRLAEIAYGALAAEVPEAAILHLGAAAGRGEEGLATADRVVRGEPGAAVWFRECGLRFRAELAGGQKTGFYCDQRENRRLAERLAAGRSVLDLFAHSGAFALYALRGGATRVTAVESAPRFSALAREQADANGLEPERLRWQEANVFDWLRQAEDEHGLVVCDPPPLARRRSAVDAAARAYKDLNRLAMRRTARDGYLLTFSCSGAIDGKLFRQILFAAATEAGRRVVLLGPLAAGPDHPVAITHPEGEYLKGWWCRVEGPAIRRR
jgi:23S rRNA (cytosine1962-C5)-methyltransferase